MSAAAVIVARQNKLIRRFWEAGATAPKFARSPEDLGCRNSWIFRRLVTRGVFEETKPCTTSMRLLPTTSCVCDERRRREC